MELININNYDKIYLTPNIVINKGNTFYEDENNKKLKINNNNWHLYLIDYGWSKLDYGWILRLNRHNKNKNKNSRWGLLECGGNGDCLFNVISVALYEPNMNDIRKIASSGINEDNFNLIIESYRTEYDSGEFYNLWNPYNIKTAQQLRNELIKDGNNYWGDHIIIQLLSNILNINFIILNNEKYYNHYVALKDRCTINNIGIDYNKNKKSIILYYIDNCHYQLVGYFNNYMITLFDNIPEELLEIYYIDCKKN